MSVFFTFIFTTVSGMFDSLLLLINSFGHYQFYPPCFFHFFFMLQSRNEGLELTSEKLVDLALNADARFLDHFMDLLKKRREQISNNVTRRKNIMLNEFIDEMITQREEKLRQLQNELSILRNDKASIEVIACIHV